jgi:hypothetical protein
VFSIVVEQAKAFEIKSYALSTLTTHSVLGYSGNINAENIHDAMAAASYPPTLR